VDHSGCNPAPQLRIIGNADFGDGNVTALANTEFASLDASDFRSLV